jgi:hypothetical protein
MGLLRVAGVRLCRTLKERPKLKPLADNSAAQGILDRAQPRRPQGSRSAPQGGQRSLDSHLERECEICYETKMNVIKKFHTGLDRDMAMCPDCRCAPPGRSSDWLLRIS